MSWLKSHAYFVISVISVLMIVVMINIFPIVSKITANNAVSTIEGITEQDKNDISTVADIFLKSYLSFETEGFEDDIIDPVTGKRSDGIPKGFATNVQAPRLAFENTRDFFYKTSPQLKEPLKDKNTEHPFMILFKELKVTNISSTSEKEGDTPLVDLNTKIFLQKWYAELPTQAGDSAYLTQTLVSVPAKLTMAKDGKIWKVYRLTPAPGFRHYLPYTDMSDQSQEPAPGKPLSRILLYKTPVSGFEADGREKD